MLIEREALERMIPHTGAMCLLAGVSEADASRIVCVASSHRDSGNPLRRRGVLPAVCGIEYASQAMAAHGAWRNGATAKPMHGMLVSVREASWSLARLDAIGGELMVEATLEAGDERSASYRFTLTADTGVVLVGRAAVVFAPEHE